MPLVTAFGTVTVKKLLIDVPQLGRVVSMKLSNGVVNWLTTRFQAAVIPLLMEFRMVTLKKLSMFVPSSGSSVVHPV